MTHSKVEISPTEAAERYFKSCKGEVRDKTLQTQRTPIKQFVAWCEKNDGALTELNALDLQAFYDHPKERGLKMVTRRMCMTGVRQFLMWGERVEVAPKDLADKAHWPVLEKDERKRDTEIDPDRVRKIVEWLERYKYASRDHITVLLLFRSGLRTGSLYSCDTEDFTEIDGVGAALKITHRPDRGTPLKNGQSGERPVNLSEETAEAVRSYLSEHRHDVTDDHGREPLLTSKKGRLCKSSIRSTCYL